MDRGSKDEDATIRGTFRVRDAAPLPDVLDVFVAGGGPAGTAAAVRAKELGLSCLVVDYDDLLKRIRDYPKEKLIKPGYGGGDKLPFPSGPMLQALHFDDIDKDDMVSVWKSKYREFGLNARVGSELTGLEREADGLWKVRTWNHRAGSEAVYRARNVIVAIGAGVPRRFDIPGDTDGIAFRLNDPKDYTGRPALVIGGGTSAAEAVIAISQAKMSAEDETPVYWSYRGGSMPKVSKALSEVFFTAYVGNGNIRYLPYSEPTAVITADDKLDYLSVRVDRKIAEGRPPETVHLEFDKRSVVACIGEDLPVRLLQGMGIRIPAVNNRPYMLVSHDGEVSLPGVFLVGDARGPRYLRCTSFEDSTTYEQITERRNIKAAMVDAVKVVEVIAARSGQVLPKAEPTPEVLPAPRPEGRPSVVPPAAEARAQDEGVEAQVRLTSIHPDDTIESEYPIRKAQTVVGRASMDVPSPDDAHMAPEHAAVVERGGRWFLEDRSGGAGTWIRVRGKLGRKVEDAGLVWVGSQILMALRDGETWSIAHYDSAGRHRATHPIGERGVFVGRSTDLSLDPSDASLSRRHAQLRPVADGLEVSDLGSRNGTFLKIPGPVALENGDEFRAGSRRFRFERFEPVAKLSASDVVGEARPEPSIADPVPATPPPTSSEILEGQFAVEIEHPEHAVRFGVPAGTDVLHAYFANLRARFPDVKLSPRGEPTDHMDEPLGWECKVGLCGLCAVEVVEGAESLEPPDPGSPEMKTIETVAALDPDPKRYRLACVAKLKGPVKLKIPS